MRVFKILKVAIPVIALAVILPIAAIAGVPEVSHVMVTDVTTVSFSVIWAASEASTADLEVYEDVDGTIPVTGAVITSHPVSCGDPTIKTAAEDNGVMKVRVTGLSADTTYYFQTVTTSKSPPGITYEPASAPFTSVTTEIATTRSINSNGDEVPFSNDIIIESCYLEDGITPADGTLLLATIEGANYPLTAFVGDGVDAPYALIDLNNAFDRETHENLDLSQGKNLTLLNFRGKKGYSVVSQDLPEDFSLSEIKYADCGIKSGWNFLSIQLEPNDTSLATVMDPIMDDIIAVWSYDTLSDDWSRYDKNNPFPWLNDLENVYSLTGYWVLADSETSLLTNGSFMTDEPIQLYAGWNLVGYKSIETRDLMDAISMIYDHLNAIWTYDTKDDRWLRYDKNNPFPWLNDLQYVEPGKAYWIKVTENCEW